MATIRFILRISEYGLMGCVALSLWLEEEGWTVGALVKLIRALRFCSWLGVLFLEATEGHELHW